MQNVLGNDGFPRLNFAGKESSFFENYGDPDINMGTESLAYLFSLNDNGYKRSYSNVQGLFQMDAQGYYYYDSKKNFAEFDGKSRFILYDSPGVGKEPDDPNALASEGNYGQFFPFNKALLLL